VKKYLEKNNIQNIKLINIKCLKNFNFFINFVKEIKECETIFSSSLHGIIISDIYNIKSHTIEITDYYYQKNCGFLKFEDYYQSVKRDFIKYKFEDLFNNSINETPNYQIKIDIKKILENFPFIHPNVKEKCFKMLDNNYLEHIKI
jgi:hypothetical protein